MNIDDLANALHQNLAQSAAVGGPEVATAAERLLSALGPALRLTLMEALNQAAAEIRAAGAPVDLRMNGREPQFVVHAAQQPEARPEPADDGEAVARITLRLPEALKGRAEVLAAQRGQSLNTWLVAAARAAAAGTPSPEPGRHGPGQRLKGWAR